MAAQTKVFYQRAANELMFMGMASWWYSIALNTIILRFKFYFPFLSMKALSLSEGSRPEEGAWLIVVWPSSGQRIGSVILWLCECVEVSLGKMLNPLVAAALLCGVNGYLWCY